MLIFMPTFLRPPGSICQMLFSVPTFPFACAQQMSSVSCGSLPLRMWTARYVTYASPGSLRTYRMQKACQAERPERSAKSVPTLRAIRYAPDCDTPVPQKDL